MSAFFRVFRRFRGARPRTVPLAGAAVLCAALLCGLTAGCTDEPPRPAYRGDGVCYPVAMRADPQGRYLYVAGANFDRAFRAGILRTFDAWQGEWTGGDTVEVPSYISAMALEPITTTGTDRKTRIWLTDRDQDAVTAVDATRKGGAEPTLGCGGRQVAACPQECTSKTSFGGSSPSALNLGSDPIELSVAADALTGTRLVHVVATSDSRMSVLSTEQTADGVTAKLVGHVSYGPGGGLAGARTSPLTGRTYVSDARAPVLYSYSVGDRTDKTAGATDPTREMQVHAPIILPQVGSGEYGRGIALSHDGGRLYVAYRNPNALLIIDIAPGIGGVPADRLLGVIALGGSPAKVIAAASGPGGAELIYISCYGSDDIWIVDPKQRAVRGTIRLPHSPFDLAILDDGKGGHALFAGLFARHSLVKVPLIDGLPTLSAGNDWTDEYRATDCVASTDADEVKACE